MSHPFRCGSSTLLDKIGCYETYREFRVRRVCPQELLIVVPSVHCTRCLYESPSPSARQYILHVYSTSSHFSPETSVHIRCIGRSLGEVGVHPLCVSSLGSRCAGGIAIAPIVFLSPLSLSQFIQPFLMLFLSRPALSSPANVLAGLHRRCFDYLFPERSVLSLKRPDSDINPKSVPRYPQEG